MKKHNYIIILLCLLLLIMTAGTIYIVDPYYFYRVESDENIFLEKELYQNPGMLKNYDYTSVITGSSMTENFNYTLFNELFSTKTLKAPYQGAYSRDVSFVLERAFKYKANIDNVFLGLDISMLVNSPNEFRFKSPEHMLQENKVNLSYLLDKNVLYDIYKKEKQGNGNLETAYNWSSKFTFSKETVMKSYKKPEEIATQISENAYNDIVNQNLENIIPYVQKYQNTTFYIFFPPYSILFWDLAYRNGNLNAYYKVEMQAIESLIKYENVQLFYYQDLEDIILNLDNYKDYSHYSPEINNYITETMANKFHMITKDNYIERINNLNSLVMEYEK